MGDTYIKEAKFWQRTSKCYPNASACIGSEIGVFHNIHWWHAIGQAREEFKVVELDILEQLTTVFTDSYSSIVHFHLYMIGRSAELAIPTIMVFCEEKEPRKKAKKAIEQGGFLGKLPGFRIGHQAKQPGVGSLIQPATGNDGMDQHMSYGPASDVYFDPSRSVQAVGMPIFVKHSNALLRQATANAMFEGQRCVYMSVSHVFFDTTTTTHKAATEADSEYDFGSGTEFEDEDEWMDVTSRASISSPEESLDDRPDSASPESGSSTSTNEFALTQSVSSDEQFISATQIDRTNSPVKRRLTDSRANTSAPPIESLEFLGCMTRSSVDLDWAVIEIKNSNVFSKVYEAMLTTRSDHSHMTEHAPFIATQIIAHTSHGPISGSLSDTASYMRLPGSITFQKVYQITLDAPLDWGDCGTGVSDVSTMRPYGHVVVSSTTKCIAYIVAATEVMEASGTQWSNPSRVDLKVPSSAVEEQVTNDRSLSGCAQELGEQPLFTNPPFADFWNETRFITDFGHTPHLSPTSTKQDTISSWDSNTSTFSYASSQASSSYGSLESSHMTTNPSDKENALLSITGSTPAELKSKQSVSIVRKKAMSTFLKHEKVMAKEHRSMRTRGSANRLIQVQSWSHKEQVPNFQKSEGVILPPAPIVRPMRTDIQLPYDVFSPPPLQSIGKSLDPFRTMLSQGPQVSVEELKFHYSRYFGTLEMEKYWIPMVLCTRHAHLGTLCMASAHQDAIMERPVESLTTTALRQELIHLIGGRLRDPSTCVDNSNFIALIQLIASEVIAREEATLNWHEAGLETMIKQRGGLGQLDRILAAMISWISLESALLRETKPRTIYLDYSASNSSKSYPHSATIPESPLYNPRGTYVTLQRSAACKGTTLEILSDIGMMMDIFIHETTQRRGSPQTILNIYKKITEYQSVSQLRQRAVLTSNDWKYEAIRIVSALQAEAIVKRLSLSESFVHTAGQVRPSSLDSFLLLFPPMSGFYDDLSSASSSSYGRSTNSSESTSSTSYYSRLESPIDVPLPSSSSEELLFFPPPPKVPHSDTDTILRKLKTALEFSDLSNCWSEMAGVLLWIGLTVGAASRNSTSKTLKKYFAALAVRVSFFLCFEHPEALHATLLRMGEIIQGLSSPNAEIKRGKYVASDSKEGSGFGSTGI